MRSPVDCGFPACVRSVASSLATKARKIVSTELARPAGTREMRGSARSRAAATRSHERRSCSTARRNAGDRDRPIALPRHGDGRRPAAPARRSRAASATLRVRRAASRGSMRLATQPASAQPARANRLRRQQRVIEAAQAHADDQQHRQIAGVRAMSSMSCRASSGTSTPPAPSTTTTSAARREPRDTRPRCAARSMVDAGLARRRDAARSPARKRIRIAIGKRRVDVAGARRARRRRRCTRSPGVDAGGDRASCRRRARPRAASARSSATATTVLPTPVSVPVTKMPRASVPGGLRAAVELHDRHGLPRVRLRLALPRVAVDRPRTSPECARRARIASSAAQRALASAARPISPRGRPARRVGRADRLQVAQQRAARRRRSASSVPCPSPDRRSPRAPACRRCRACR